MPASQKRMDDAVTLSTTGWEVKVSRSFPIFVKERDEENNDLEGEKDRNRLRQRWRKTRCKSGKLRGKQRKDTYSSRLLMRRAKHGTKDHLHSLHDDAIPCPADMIKANAVPRFQLVLTGWPERGPTFRAAEICRYRSLSSHKGKRSAEGQNPPCRIENTRYVPDWI